MRLKPDNSCYMIVRAGDSEREAAGDTTCAESVTVREEEEMPTSTSCVTSNRQSVTACRVPARAGSG